MFVVGVGADNTLASFDQIATRPVKDNVAFVKNFEKGMPGAVKKIVASICKDNIGG